MTDEQQLQVMKEFKDIIEDKMIEAAEAEAVEPKSRLDQLMDNMGIDGVQEDLQYLSDLIEEKIEKLDDGNRIGNSELNLISDDLINFSGTALSGLGNGRGENVTPWAQIDNETAAAVIESVVSTEEIIQQQQAMLEDLRTQIDREMKGGGPGTESFDAQGELRGDVNKLLEKLEDGKPVDYEDGHIVTHFRDDLGEIIERAEGFGMEILEVETTVSPNTTIVNAVREGDMQGVKAALEQGADVNHSVAHFEQTPLHYAAQAGNLEIAEYLLEQGADFTLVDRHEDRPLDKAMEGGHEGMAGMLARHEASVEIGQTPSPAEIQRDNMLQANDDVVTQPSRASAELSPT
jgi:hypothetical protein